MKNYYGNTSLIDLAGAPRPLDMSFPDYVACAIALMEDAGVTHNYIAKHADLADLLQGYEERFTLADVVAPVVWNTEEDGGL